MIVKQVPPETTKQLNELWAAYKQAEHEYFSLCVKVKRSMEEEVTSRFDDKHEFLVVAQ